MLFEFILERFEKERTQFEYYFQHPEEVHIALAKGAEKARKVAHEVLLRVRDKVGY
jgi:tryptophanyl-tRNA synthetase